MKSRLALVLTAALAAAACSSQDDAAVATPRPGSGANAGSGPAAAAMTVGRFAMSNAATAHRFAAIPDRGVLTVYPKARVVRRDGAYTWHRADLSEAHARSAVGGVLAFTTPAGELLRFRYERHVEHANGDWTWIGSIVGRKAEEAIITFGAKAAFGTIAQPGKEPLRLTIRDGASWLVETDPREIAKLQNVGTRPTEPDFIVAPSLAAQPRTTGGRAAGDAPPTAGATAVPAGVTAANTIDVVLGYTPGFVSYYGGDSQALTRLNNMVDITNEAYVNSQVDARVRLVRTLLVNYTDANDNKTALQELTGYQNGSRTAPAAAFSELRAAREQHGADLVSLVRRFNTPENDGCGIAWLLGGGRAGSISAGSEYFGYSVVNDGRDAGTDGKTYICRDETLAHELGHNLGSAHDRDAADGDDNVLQNSEYGVFEYSFGYKTTSSEGNFYTIMAYGDSGQTRYRTFSNPRTTFCGGLACGVDNQADNARTLTQTIPIVSTFRAAVQPAEPPTPPATAKAVNDVDADGKSDLLWYSGAAIAWWRMNGASVSGSGGQGVPAGYSVLATGDLDGDRRADIVWQTDAGQLVLWRGASDGYTATVIGTYPTGWTLAAAADINGDSRTDLVWQNAATVSWWLMQGPTITSSNGRAAATGSDVLAAADFNGDGKADLVWQNESGMLTMWLSTGSDFSVATLGDYPRGWSSVGAGDVDGDRKTDLIWSNSTTVAWWRMDGASVAGSGGQALASPGTRVSLADFDGDGISDIVWVNQAYGMSYWRGTGSGFSAVAMPEYPAQWSAIRSGARAQYVAAPSDRNSDGRSDLLWHNGATLAWWHLRGASIVSSGGQSTGAGASMLGLGNFDGDGRSDVLWRDGANRLQLWQAAGSGFLASEIGGYPVGWTLAGIGDIDGDGRADVLWHNGVTLAWWHMDQAAVRASGGQSMGTGSEVLGIGDIDGDGRDDVVWRDASNRVLAWLARGSGFAQAAITGFPTGWTLRAVADVNGDERADLLWHNGTTLAWWHLRGVSIIGSGGQSMGAGSSVIGTYDVDGNGRADVAWRDASGNLVLWTASGPGFAQATLTSFPVGWTAVKP
ncbi:MAG: FG-GAP-like repeat-containing protein [Pseudomonadota bacterium]